MDAEIERRLSRPVNLDVNDGLPVFENLTVPTSSVLTASERVVLGQIVQLEDLWSINTISELHREIIEAFAAESGVPYSEDMGTQYMSGIIAALSSLKEKGFVENVPGQDTSGKPAESIRWRMVAQ